MFKGRWILVGVLAVAGLALSGWGAVEGAGGGMMPVAKAGDAALEADPQPGAKGSIVIDRVVSPEDAWVVVHLEAEGGGPGMRVGLRQVRAGETRDLRVALEDGMLTGSLLVALHKDGGKAGEFEFDMEKMEHSPDRPYFVEGEEMAITVEVAENGGE